MHCISIYPTKDEDLELNQISILKKRYPHVTIGYSTHEDPENYDAIKIACSL
jgi:sialic acid synthase SpsE